MTTTEEKAHCRAAGKPSLAQRGRKRAGLDAAQPQQVRLRCAPVNNGGRGQHVAHCRGWVENRHRGGPSRSTPGLSRRWHSEKGWRGSRCGLGRGAREFGRPATPVARTTHRHDGKRFCVVAVIPFNGGRFAVHAQFAEDVRKFTGALCPAHCVIATCLPLLSRKRTRQAIHGVRASALKRSAAVAAGDALPDVNHAATLPRRRISSSRLRSSGLARSAPSVARSMSNCRSQGTYPARTQSETLGCDTSSAVAAAVWLPKCAITS